MTKFVVSCVINGKLHFFCLVFIPLIGLFKLNKKILEKIIIINQFLLNQTDITKVERFLSKLRWSLDRDSLKKNKKTL